MKVIFVDDEPLVLRGIERMLDTADVDWECEFSESGDDALSLMDQQPFDAIVSDMKMPSMDGAQLLHNVSTKYPDVIRIILSGQADKEAVFRTIRPMHQYLAKPCDAETLVATINRACELRSMLNSTELRELTSKVSSLPSVPSVYTELMNTIADGDYSTGDLTQIVARDPALTAKMLQIANSAAFGIGKPITTPAQAVSYLGSENIRSLALCVGVFEQYDCGAVGGFSIDALLQHCLDVAQVAVLIAQSEKIEKKTIDEIFTAGVLHDVGKLILATDAAEPFQRALDISQQKKCTSAEAEHEVFGTDHAAVGAYLLSLWGIPQSIVEMVALHHEPWKTTEQELSPEAIIYTANQLINSAGEISPETSEFLGQLNRQERWQVWADKYFESGSTE